MTKLKSWIAETRVLLRSVPATVVTFFVMSVIMMNLLANKTIVDESWIALDGGIMVSWLAFLSMDIITKRFGYKAANKISIFTTGLNLLACLVFWLVSIIPTSYDFSGFNMIFGGTWFILLGSTVAFLASAFINNFLNFTIKKMFKKNEDGKAAFVTSTYISTFIGQFCDNLIFSTIVFMFFAPIFWDGFSWTFIQCIACALTGAVVELIFEVVFSPIAYKLQKRWKQQNVGKEYLDYIEGK